MRFQTAIEFLYLNSNFTYTFLSYLSFLYDFLHIKGTVFVKNNI